MPILFTILLFASCGYAWLAGGKDGRWVTAMLISAALLTIPASQIDHSWSRTQLPVLAVDLLLLIGLGIVAARTRVFWPIWLAGLHLANVLTHAATIALPSWRPEVYYAMQSFWSVPELVLMVAGIMLDQRAADERRIRHRETGG